MSGWNNWPKSRSNLYPTAEERSHDYTLPSSSAGKEAKKKVKKKDQRIWRVRIVETDGASIFSFNLTYLEAQEMRIKVLKKLKSILVKRKCTVEKARNVVDNCATDYFDYLLDIEREGMTNSCYGDLSHDQANYLDGILQKEKVAKFLVSLNKQVEREMRDFEDNQELHQKIKTVNDQINNMILELRNHKEVGQNDNKTSKEKEEE